MGNLIKIILLVLVVSSEINGEDEYLQVPGETLDLKRQNNTAVDWSGFKPVFQDKDPRFVSFTSTARPANSQPSFVQRVRGLFGRKPGHFGKQNGGQFNSGYNGVQQNVKNHGNYNPKGNYPIPGSSDNQQWGNPLMASNSAVGSYVRVQSMGKGLKRYFNNVMNMLRRSFMQRRNSFHNGGNNHLRVVQATPGATSGPVLQKKRRVVKVGQFGYFVRF